MATLKFKDGVEVNFTDSSTVSNMVTIVNTFAELDKIKTEFEKDKNFVGGEFNGDPISQIVYTGVTTRTNDDGKIIATFSARPFTHDELVDARLADLEDVVSSM